MKNLPLFLCVVCAVSAASFAPVMRAQGTPGVPGQYEFGDQGSATLTGKAWQAYEASDIAAVKAYTGRCIELYKADAIKQQASLTEPVPTSNPEAVHAMWALNDVGTCYFILGQALEKKGDYAEAVKAYREVADKLAFAKCWDTKGWFWSPADAAKGRIKALEFDAAMM